MPKRLQEDAAHIDSKTGMTLTEYAKTKIGIEKIFEAHVVMVKKARIGETKNIYI